MAPRWNPTTLVHSVQLDYEKTPKLRPVRLTGPAARVGDLARVVVSGIEVEGRIIAAGSCPFFSIPQDKERGGVYLLRATHKHRVIAFPGITLTAEGHARETRERNLAAEAAPTFRDADGWSDPRHMRCADQAGGSMATRKAAKRERLDTRVGGTRFVRRRPDGTFKGSDQLGPSMAADRRQRAKTKVKSGRGDRGDR